MKKILAAAILQTMLFALPGRAANEITIGLFTELSGSFAASAGYYCRIGYETARALYAPGDSAGEHPLRFVYGDTKGEAKTALSEFAKLTDVHHAHVLVSNRSQVGMALTAAAIQKKFPIAAVMGYSRLIEDNPFAFRFYSSARQEGWALADKMKELGFLEASIVSLEDEWYESFRGHFRQRFSRIGGRLDYDETMPEATAGFETVVSRIRAAGSKAVVVNLGPTQNGPFLRQLRNQGIRAQLFGNYYSRAKEVFEAAGAEALEGLITVELDADKPLLAAEMKRRFENAEPNPLSYGCFSALSFVVQTIEQTPGPISSPAEMHRAMSGMQQVRLPDGAAAVKDAEAQFSFCFKQVRNGKLVTFVR